MPTDDVPITTLHVERDCACPFSTAQDYAVDYLALGETGGPGAVMHVPLLRHLPLLRRRVQLSFGLSIDIAEGGRRHDEIRLRWDSGSRLIPPFRGTVRFRIVGASRTCVVIDGSYVPPLGRLGRWFDWWVGRHVARRTLLDLADRIGGELERRERAWCATHAFPTFTKPS